MGGTIAAAQPAKYSSSSRGEVPGSIGPPRRAAEGDEGGHKGGEGGAASSEDETPNGARVGAKADEPSAMGAPSHTAGTAVQNGDVCVRFSLVGQEIRCAAERNSEPERDQPAANADSGDRGAATAAEPPTAGSTGTAGVQSRGSAESGRRLRNQRERERASTRTSLSVSVNKKTDSEQRTATETANRRSSDRDGLWLKPQRGSDTKRRE